MNYKGKIVLDDKEAKRIRRYCCHEPKNEGEFFDGQIEHVYRFINGFEAEIKCCSVLSYEEGGCNTAWTEGILFDAGGHELVVTDVSEDYEGIWDFDYNGDHYEVEVVTEFEQFRRESYRLYKLDWMMSHGISPEDIVRAIEEQILEDPENTSVHDAFEAVKNEVGFGQGSMWACYGEFICHEFWDLEYMKHLVSNMTLEMRTYFYRKIMGKRGAELRRAVG